MGSIWYSNELKYSFSAEFNDAEGNIILDKIVNSVKDKEEYQIVESSAANKRIINIIKTGLYKFENSYEILDALNKIIGL